MLVSLMFRLIVTFDPASQAFNQEQLVSYGDKIVTVECREYIYGEECKRIVWIKIGK